MASRFRLREHIRTYFIAGILVTGPIALTLYLAWSFVRTVDSAVSALLPKEYNPETYLPFYVPGIGLIVLVLGLTLIGALTAGYVGRVLVRVSERLLERMPVVRGLYSATKQIFETLFSSSGSSFRRVGLVEFPAPGMWSLVFLTQSPSAPIAAHLPPTEHVSAFMPCTPNPTTGFFFYVPRRDLIELDISVEQAMSLLISAGIIQPDGGADAQDKLAALADTARAAQAMRNAAPTTPAATAAK